MRIAICGSILGLSIVAAIVSAPSAHSETRACSADIYSALRKTGPVTAAPVEIDCALTLANSDTITAPIAFSGGASSGAVLDCKGGTLDGRKNKARTVVIRSVQRSDGTWDAPRDISIRNCTIMGDVRIQGLGHNGQAEKVRQSSLREGHTERAQASAPTGILLQNITFVADGGIPLYAAPGVTRMSVENSRFTGSSISTAIYLDAETAGNRIVGNIFDIRTSRREIVAVDGSAENKIENNTFENPVNGGIFLYRNCGEGGTIRQQAPQRNIIAGNVFRYRDTSGARPAIWLGSRQGISLFNSYCLVQPGMILDSLNHRDGAQNNVVTGNRLQGEATRLIVDDDAHNTVSNNN